MPTRIIADQEESLCYLKSVIDGDLSDVVSITWRRHGTGFAILKDVETKRLDLDQGGPKKQSDCDLTTGTVTSPGSKLSPEEAAALPSRSNEPFKLAAFLQSEDFDRDHMSADVVEDTSNSLQRRVIIETKQLGDDQWLRLMSAGRLKKIAILLVVPILKSRGKTHRSRVVAVEFLREEESPQPELFIHN